MSEGEHFNCRACEFQSARQDITYDALGFPVCPICGANHDPFESQSV